MTIIAHPGDTGKTERLRGIALGYLHLTREQMDTAKNQRLTYIRLGRQYGLTWEAMGEALGITETAVRLLVKRSAG